MKFVMESLQLLGLILIIASLLIFISPFLWELYKIVRIV